MKIFLEEMCVKRVISIIYILFDQIYIFLFRSSSSPNNDRNSSVEHTTFVQSIQNISSSRESYAKYSPIERYDIGKFASETGDAAAVRKYRKKFPRLNESTVRGFRKKYQQIISKSAKKNMSPIKGIDAQRRGRKLKLGNKLAKKSNVFCMHCGIVKEKLHSLSR